MTGTLFFLVDIGRVWKQNKKPLKINLRCAVCMLLLSIWDEDRILTDCFKWNNTLPLVLHSFVPTVVFLCCYFYSPPLALISLSNKHRCSHTLTLIFKHLPFYESGEIYPLPSLSLPSATPIVSLLHTFFIVFSVFLLPLSSPTLCEVLVLSFSHLCVFMWASKLPSHGLLKTLDRPFAV